MTQEQIIEKVKKLLNVNGRTEEEAKTAMAKAQELIAKYNIEMSDLEKQESRIVMEKIATPTKRVSVRFESLVVALADHYRCKVARSYYDIWLMGYQTDVQAATLVINYAYDTFNKLFDDNYAKNFRDRHDRILAKNQYLRGFIEGSVYALTENEQKYALVLCVPNEVEEEFSKKTSKAEGRSRHMAGAETMQQHLMHYQGVTDGMNTFRDKARLTTTQIA